MHYFVSMRQGCWLGRIFCAVFGDEVATQAACPSLQVLPRNPHDLCVLEFPSIIKGRYAISSQMLNDIM